MILKDAIDTIYDSLLNLDSYFSDEIWEKTNDGWKLILSFFGSVYNNELPVIHLKIILWTNNDKTEIENKLCYLHDLNCIYNIRTFNDTNELSNTIKIILDENLFGKNLKGLSKYTMFSVAAECTKYLKNDAIIKNWEFKPQNKNIPCEDLNFDYIFNIENIDNNGNCNIRFNGINFIINVSFNNKNTQATCSNIDYITKIIADAINNTL